MTTAKRARSKTLKTIIRDELLVELGIGKLSNAKDKWSMQHCGNLIQDRDDLGRLPELVDLFRVANSAKGDGIQKFYFWYKDNQVESADCYVYLFFDSASETLGLPQADPTKFAGLGSALLERIEFWREGSGNSADSILADYFVGILPKAVNINATLATSPKSLLDNFGWDLWEQYVIETHGGKTHYLDASPYDLELARTKGIKLLKIQYIKDQALQNKDLELYDKIGKLLTTKGIGETYAQLYKTIGFSQTEPIALQEFRS